MYTTIKQYRDNLRLCITRGSMQECNPSSPQISDHPFLIPVVIAKRFNSTAGLVMPITVLTKEANGVIGTHPVTTEAKIINFSL